MLLSVSAAEGREGVAVVTDVKPAARRLVILCLARGLFAIVLS